jgi:hypothetical protein
VTGPEQRGILIACNIKILFSPLILSSDPLQRDIPILLSCLLEFKFGFRTGMNNAGSRRTSNPPVHIELRKYHSVNL